MFAHYPDFAQGIFVIYRLFEVCDVWWESFKRIQPQRQARRKLILNSDFVSTQEMTKKKIPLHVV